MNILIIDGYIDSPGCLGVPPYLSPLPRYIYGALKLNGVKSIRYLTVDQFRKILKLKQSDQQNHPNQYQYFDFFSYRWVIFISGVSVPGKYLGGIPIHYSELKYFSNLFSKSKKILCGPATNFGIGQDGGKRAISVEKLRFYFDFIIYGDTEIVITEIFKRNLIPLEYHKEELSKIVKLKRKSMEEIKKIAEIGSEIILQHPNYEKKDGGNLICEIETFRGCPRYKTGGCSFCIEPSKGPTIHRKINSIVSEIKALYDFGVKHFRIGAQTDFYAIQHKDFENPRYPKPNPQAIENLLKNITDLCPDIKTLHIDNVNSLNFALYPNEAVRITKSIVKYCTPGNIAAIGVESIDKIVIRKNNLKANQDEILDAIKIINKFGRGIGDNGNPKFLPGLNFIMGLDGESKSSLDKNFNFLIKILNENLLVRRINLRKLLIPTNKQSKNFRKISKHLNKFRSKYFHWKKKIREEIDYPMLQKLYPIGIVLRNCYAEKNNGKGTLLRQPGTYPITSFVPKKLELKTYYDLVVVNHGFRSLNCLVHPIDLPLLSKNELVSIDGIGKKRAATIQLKRPNSFSEWNNLFPEIIDTIAKIQHYNIKD